ncbi:MbtH family protein [Actinomadura scrupuli]|uniref:MbtH family protein n=1 Tax=Actinomadura scrupuli TaxID=559629 RepID=UPI003D99C4D7
MEFPVSSDNGSGYKVLVNAEGHYSTWPVSQPNPAGWRDAGPVGRVEECLAFISAVWTDLVRPLSPCD